MPARGCDHPRGLRLAHRMSDLLSARHVRELAAAARIHPSKQRGQNFVVDPNTVRAIVDRAGVTRGDAVLEIGPGLGSLTLGLLEAGADVAAIEIDSGLARLLPQTLTARGIDPERFRLVHADALAVHELPVLPRSGPPRTLVANLPYNVATPILLTHLERFEQIDRAVVMVQSEVVDRLCAGPASKVYGAPSVKAAWYGRAEHAGRISRQVFWPVPNVDSALVALTRRETPLGSADERERTFALIDAAFAQRRKTLRAALASMFGSGAQAEVVLEAAGIDPTRRGETLTVDDFLAIMRATSATDRVGDEAGTAARKGEASMGERRQDDAVRPESGAGA